MKNLKSYIARQRWKVGINGQKVVKKVVMTLYNSDWINGMKVLHCDSKATSFPIGQQCASIMQLIVRSSTRSTFIFGLCFCILNYFKEPSFMENYEKSYIDSELTIVKKDTLASKNSCLMVPNGFSRRNYFLRIGHFFLFSNQCK